MELRTDFSFIQEADRAFVQNVCLKEKKLPSERKWRYFALWPIGHS